MDNVDTGRKLWFHKGMTKNGTTEKHTMTITTEDATAAAAIPAGPTDLTACTLCRSEDTVPTDEPVPSGTRNKVRCRDCGAVTHGMPTTAYFHRVTALTSHLGDIARAQGVDVADLNVSVDGDVAVVAWTDRKGQPRRGESIWIAPHRSHDVKVGDRILKGRDNPGRWAADIGPGRVR